MSLSTGNNFSNKKTIPGKVFYNHFHAIYFFIQSNKKRYKLKEVDYFNQLRVRNTNFNIDKCKTLLYNAWSTEYALNLAKELDNKEYYKNALHWHFPQAYYSIYLAMTAYHVTQGMANDVHEKSIKQFGNEVMTKHYPEAISFYAKGGYKDFEYQGVSSKKQSDFQSLGSILTIKDAEQQLMSFLKTTRNQNAKDKKERARNQHAKDKRFQNKEGNLTQVYRKKHWDIILSNIPQTTILNLLYRHRIKANYHDIETFMNADFDFKKFHKYLCQIVSYLNFVHEAYMCKAVGKKNYERVLAGFETSNSVNYAAFRFEKHIKPII